MSSLKQMVKDGYQKMSLVYHAKESKKYIKHLIANSADPVPELTSREKKEILSYWNQYGIHLGNTAFHRFMYAKTGIHDPRFIPPWVAFNVIFPYLNRTELGKSWEDKAFLSCRLNGLKNPEVIFSNINGLFYDGMIRPISASCAEEKLSSCEKVIVKPTLDSGCGNGVALFEAPLSFHYICSKYDIDFIIQAPIHQHPAMAKFNESSVNCIRVNSLLWGGDVQILSTFMHIGQSGSLTDNSGDSWLAIRADSNGILTEPIFDASYRREPADSTKYSYLGFQIPSFNEIIQLAKAAHLQYPYFKLIGWDICVDETSNPMIIEANLNSPGVVYPQIISGPFFGEKTDMILSSFASSKKRG